MSVPIIHQGGHPIEIRFNRDGVDEGTLSLAARIAADRKTSRIVLETDGAPP